MFRGVVEERLCVYLCCKGRNEWLFHRRMHFERYEFQKETFLSFVFRSLVSNSCHFIFFLCNIFLLRDTYMNLYVDFCPLSLKWHLMSSNIHNSISKIIFHLKRLRSFCQALILDIINIVSSFLIEDMILRLSLSLLSRSDFRMSWDIYAFLYIVWPRRKGLKDPLFEK